jgi:hypothetical protein
VETIGKVVQQPSAGRSLGASVCSLRIALLQARCTCYTAAVEGQRAAGSGQLVVSSRQWAVGSGQWAVGSEQWTVVRGIS